MADKNKKQEQMQEQMPPEEQQVQQPSAPTPEQLERMRQVVNAARAEKAAQDRQKAVEEAPRRATGDDDSTGMNLTSPADDEQREKMPPLPQRRVGQVGAIGKPEVRKAEELLQKYKEGKTALERRIVQNEQWFRLRNWDTMPKSGRTQIEPTSAWLLNSLANKHADAMDNYPEPQVLPREATDEEDADTLTKILPVVLEQSEFEQVYNDCWWYKLKTGTCAYGVFWNPDAANGLGDISVRCLDLLNLYWEPGVTDIQQSANLFHVELMDRDMFNDRWPEFKDEAATAGGSIDTAQYIYEDSIDTSDKVVVVDWYYKVRSGSRTLLHYCKFSGGNVLYASENDPAYSERGYYDHAMFPVVFDVLFPVAGSPAGFGYLDVCKSPQEYIDRLDQAILKQSIMTAQPRFFVRQDGNINEEEFADWSKAFVHFNGSGNPMESVMPISVTQVSGGALTMRQYKVDELKETSGNRDFAQGATSGGVTAATAIAALQEAGNKLTRDMIKSSYRSFTRICNICIELIRQFYDDQRMFRIIGENGKPEFVGFSGKRIQPQYQGQDFGMDMGYRLPVFDVTVIPQKRSPFNTAVENERAKELYGMGFFNPQMSDQALAALDMMTFEGIDKVRDKISENGTLFMQNQQLQQQVMQLAAVIDNLNARLGNLTNFASGAPDAMGAQNPAPGTAKEAKNDRNSNSPSTGDKAGDKVAREMGTSQRMDAARNQARVSMP